MKGEKVLVFDPHYCTGCMYCMTACSTYNNGATSFLKSRIHIIRHEAHAITKMNEEDDLIFDMITCQQCDQPYCLYLCPVLAIEKNINTGAIMINHDKCLGCRMCIVGCPFGAIHYDLSKQKVVKCELCDGDPQCVRFCASGALQFIPKNLAHFTKRDRLAKKMVQLYSKLRKEKLF